MDCTICTEKIKDSVELECHHSFCKECLREWFKSKKICPICRASSNKFPEIESKGIDYEHEEYADDNNNHYDLTDSSDSDDSYMLDDQESFGHDDMTDGWDVNLSQQSVNQGFDDDWYIDGNGLLMARPKWNIPHIEQIIGRTIRHSSHDVTNAGRRFEELATQSYNNAREDSYKNMYDELINQKIIIEGEEDDEEFKKIIDELDVLMMDDT